jgi:uncharacterized SAM-binding protein YcdF (DUF218 family)
MKSVLRLLALAVLAYVFGFLWFVFAMPQPAGDEHSDAIVVLTGGELRITTALQSLQAKRAPRLFVAGVDPKVRPREFAAQYHVTNAMMACCITLDFKSTDTITNAREAAGWIKAKGYGSVRLVTSDWHMRRAALELARVAPADLRITRDAVPSRPSFTILVLEYNKLLARWARWGHN